MPSDIQRVYLAGKIGKNDWRHSLVPCLRGAVESGECPSGGADAPNDTTPWPQLPFRAGDYPCLYVGPYFLCCDHGCWHGDGTHAAIRPDRTADVVYDSIDGRRDIEVLPSWGGMMGLRLVARCCAALKIADVVFAWVDQPDCYGTLWEMGYARALGKLCYVSFANVTLAREMWFMANSTVSAYVTDTAGRGLERALMEGVQL